MIEVLKQALEALEVAQDNLRKHEDNCFLHDDGEYARCFCGKDSLSNYLQEQFESLDQAIAELESQYPHGMYAAEDLDKAWKSGYDNCKDQYAYLNEQEPVAWADHGVVNWIADKQFKHPSLLYTHPLQRKPLTDEQIQDVVNNAVRAETLSWLGYRKDNADKYTIPVLSPSDYQFARAIEAAHGIKE